MDLEPDNNPEQTMILKSAFNRFKQMNKDFMKSGRLMPDSLVIKFGGH